MKIYKTMPSGVRLVEYDDTLAGAIADMWNKSGDSWGGDSGIQTAEQVIATHSSGSFFNVFIAMYNDEVVGYCSFDRYYKDADTAYVHLLNVRPDFHGHKIGKELVLLCVQRTIELGYPRLDIHTWAGNTKAVPLYKKCGFLWEDRTDTTHLSNFIPTVLKTELFSEFFKDADWYDDSSRIIEIKPDGVKVNKFEVYGYSWTKNGKNLAVGFEKTGRRIRYVETDDYKIEFIGVNHELAFGLNYKCAFKVENKSGKELHIKISGKDDNGIKFNFNAEDNVEKTAEFDAEFYIGEITEELDTWRMHPCVLADVYINGKHAEFGIGIEPKFPLDVRFIEKRGIARQGMTEDVYINIKSFLLQNASVTFQIPENAMTRFDKNNFTAETEPNSTHMLAVKAEILKCGYEKLDITYNITLADGSKTSFKKPLHLINQGIDGMYEFETDTEYCAVNGLWKLSLDKRNNFTSFYRMTHGGYARFPISKLGKPYDDEFNLAKPSDVKIYNRIGEYGEALMIFEASYESSKFAGIVMTEISEFNASGVISHRHKVKNSAQKPMQLYLSENLWTNIARRAVFHYDGSIRELVDDTAYGIDDIHSEKIDENWIFDTSPRNPAGIYWAKEYRPHTRWTDELIFEHDTGELLAGESFETKPVVYMSGIFNNFKDFRNYVLSLNEEITPYTNKPLNISINDGNPFIGAEKKTIEAVVKNNRLKAYEGTLALKSSDNLFDKLIQTNPPKEITEKNIFTAELNSNSKAAGIYFAELELNFQNYEKKQIYALFMADSSNKVITNETDGVYTVNNGKISFKVSSEYSDAVYSLKCGETEWLFSKYPNIEPYSWWNPFIGGIQSILWSMSNNLVRREKRTAEFVTLNDNFGTQWTGIKSTVAINEYEEHKGMVYEQFYLTLPSLPVLCCFVRLINNTGGYKEIGFNTDAFISGKENLTDIYARIQNDDKEEYRLRMGKEDTWYGSDRFIAVSYEGKSARDEKLYVYNDSGRNNGGLRTSGDVNFFGVANDARANIADKGSFTARPSFFIISEKEIMLENIADLENIVF